MFSEKNQKTIPKLLQQFFLNNFITAPYTKCPYQTHFERLLPNVYFISGFKFVKLKGQTLMRSSRVVSRAKVEYNLKGNHNKVLILFRSKNCFFSLALCYPQLKNVCTLIFPKCNKNFELKIDSWVLIVNANEITFEAFADLILPWIRRWFL